ncbi:hypothetical protein B0H14DRAFT_2824784 [Mycena olivaceomarginata]|nr:hypothetical protein B0H14DRAFT_2824784 [Mycena olivaceomarginata]
MLFFYLSIGRGKLYSWDRLRAMARAHSFIPFIFHHGLHDLLLFYIYQVSSLVPILLRIYQFIVSICLSVQVLLLATSLPPLLFWLT